MSESRHGGNMDDSTVFTRTAKGSREASGQVHNLSGELHELLDRVDGRTSVGALAASGADTAPDQVRAALARLAERGYIRPTAPTAAAVPEVPAAALAPPPPVSLDFTAPAVADVPAPTAALDTLAGRILRQAAAHGQETPAAEPPPADAGTDRTSAAQDKQSRTREDIAAIAARKAATRAQRRAEKQARREAAAVRKRVAIIGRKRVKWGKPVALASLFLLIVVVALIHVVPFRSQIPRFESSAAAQFGVPVRIGTVHLALLPQPYWRLDGVSIGADAQIRAPRIDAFPTLGTLFADAAVFKAVVVHAPIVSAEGLAWLLFGKPPVQRLAFSRVAAYGATLDAKELSLPAFDATANVGADGTWSSIVLAATDRSLSVKLRPLAGQMQVEAAADRFAVPFGSSLTLEHARAKGTASRDELALTEFEGRIHDGLISGKLKLGWGPVWRLDGNVGAKRLDAAQIMPSVLESGRIEGQATFAAQADDPAKLFAAPRAEGNFAVDKGVLLGVDMARFPRSGEGGGKTTFARVTGEFVRDGAATRLRQLALQAGVVSAVGSAEMGENRNLRGRFVVDFAFRRVRARANLSVSGTLDVPHFHR